MVRRNYRVGQHRPDAGLLDNKQCAPNRILKHAKTNAFPLILNGNRQASQDDDQNRVLPHSFADAFGCFQRIDLANGQAEVADHAIIICNDKRLGRAASLSRAA